MPRRSVVRKSPLHASALRLKDLTMHRKVIIVNILNRSRFEAEVVSRPKLGYIAGDRPMYDGEPMTFVIDLMIGGHIGRHGLDELGVIVNRAGYWTSRAFVIDARKQHLIRKELGPNPQGKDWLDPGELWDDMTDYWDNSPSYEYDSSPS